MCCSGVNPGELLPSALHDDFGRVDHYLQVGGDGHVVQVEEVVAQALHHFVDRRGVAVLDLSPRGDAGFDALQQQVFGRTLHNLVDVELALRTRPDDGHRAAQDIVELRYLVQTYLAHEAAEGRDAGVVVLREGRTGLLGVDIHRAEFVHAERTAVHADALLGVEDGSGRRGTDDDGRDQVDRREDDDGYQRQHYVADALHRVLPFGHQTVVDDDEGGVEDGLLFDRADDEVAGVGGELDDEVGGRIELAQDAADELALVVLQGDDDLLDVVLLDERTYVVDGAQAGHQRRELRVGTLGGVAVLVVIYINVSYYYVAGVGLLVLDVEVGVVGFAAGADEEGGEADLARMDAPHGLRGDEEAEEVGQHEVHRQQEEEGHVVVAVGGGVVVEQQHEEDDHRANERGHQGVQQLFQTCLAQHIAVGAEDGVERQPARRHQQKPQPVVGVGEELQVEGRKAVAVGRRVEGQFAEGKECRPRKQCRQEVEDDIFDGLFFLHVVGFG